MPISECSAQEWTVASAPRGSSLYIVAIDTEAADLLMVHGIRLGARIIVEGGAPLGGPCIVRIGRSRVAIDRRLAKGIVVLPENDVAASGAW